MKINFGEENHAINIAHRGFSGKYPENTMLAFQKALELGVDAIELDVHLSKDGEVMVFHDEDLMRMTGEKGLLKDRSFSSCASWMLLQAIAVNLERTSFRHWQSISNC